LKCVTLPSADAVIARLRITNRIRIYSMVIAAISAALEYIVTVGSKERIVTRRCILATLSRHIIEFKDDG